MNIRELSKIAGVSPAAVSIVINNKKGVSETTRAHVKKIMEQYGYNPIKLNGATDIQRNSNLKKILFLKYRTHGMLVEENQGFISIIIDAIEAECRKRQMELNIIVSDNQFKQTLSEIDFSIYAGIIVLATELEPELYSLLDRIAIPFVAVDNRIPTSSCSSVSIDNSGNVFQALKFFAEHGHKKIAYFRSNIEIQNFKERRESFLNSVRNLGMSHSPEYEFAVTPTLLGSYKDCKSLFTNFHTSLPTCAFADNDSIALGAIKALKECGYKIPKDLSIIGFDDIPYSAISSPSLTTIKVSKEIIGQTAVNHLCTLIDNPSHHLKIQVPGNIIIRNSISFAENSNC